MPIHWRTPHRSRIKKTDVSEHPRYSTTSAYSSTSPPARPSCPSSSHPTTSTRLFGAALNAASAPQTCIVGHERRRQGAASPASRSPDGSRGASPPAGHPVFHESRGFKQVGSLYRNRQACCKRCHSGVRTVGESRFRLQQDRHLLMHQPPPFPPTVRRRPQIHRQPPIISRYHQPVPNRPVPLPASAAEGKRPGHLGRKTTSVVGRPILRLPADSGAWYDTFPPRKAFLAVRNVTLDRYRLSATRSALQKTTLPNCVWLCWLA